MKRSVPVGTRSLLFGVHQFLLHPLFVGIAWGRLFGWAWDPRLWFCFLVHDWGYWGCRSLDGGQGKRHPMRGAAIVTWLFGSDWGQFTLCHSRWMAWCLNLPPSDLCAADKLATSVYPWWLYLGLANLTGELEEYTETCASEKNPYGLEETDPVRTWAKAYCLACRGKDRQWMRFCQRRWFQAMSDAAAAWSFNFLVTERPQKQKEGANVCGE